MNRIPVLLAGRLEAAERDEWLQALAAAMPEADWCLQPRQDIELAVVANPPPGALQGLPELKLIHSLWAGVDKLLADPTVPFGVPIVRMVDPAMSRAMTETALWAVLGLHRHFFAYARQQRQAVWHQLPQRRADEVQVLVLGLGEMGSGVAQGLSRQGYRVQGWRSREGGPALAGVGVHGGEAALMRLLPEADIVANLLPLTPATRGLFDARRLGAMRTGAALVNLARGAHVVDEHLLAALDSGHLAHAVLDVFHTEPLPEDHPYWQHPKVTTLPHAAALTDARSAAEVVARNLRAWLRAEAVAPLVQRMRGY